MRPPPDKDERRPSRTPLEESVAAADDPGSLTFSVDENGDKRTSDAPNRSMCKTAARRLTDRIKLFVDSISEQLDKLTGLVAEAKAGDAHLALGYESWTAYVTAEFADSSLRLDREDRRELVAMLSGEGMSTRAIAPIVGVSHETVAKDLSESSPVRNLTPDTDAPAGRSEITIGLDGKRYEKPRPKESKPKKEWWRRPERARFPARYDPPRRYDPDGADAFEATHGVRVTVHDVTWALNEIQRRVGRIRGDNAEDVRVEISKTIPRWRVNLDEIDAKIAKLLAVEDEQIADPLDDHARRS